MRQAGRYQPEYRKIKKKHSLKDIVRQPELCAEVTMLPVRQMEVDAAILFSDIMTPLEGMNVPHEIKPNYGPYIYSPVRSAEDVAKIRIPDFKDALPCVANTIKLLREQLEVPLIGFSGAPFTLASYLVEGGKSKNYVNTKTLMYSRQGVWYNLMSCLTEAMVKYLEMQIKAGAQAVQVFDSWVGSLSREDYKEYVWPYMRELFRSLRPHGVPVIHFGLNTFHLLDLIKELDCQVVGTDWRVSVDKVWEKLQFQCALQGNLDPVTLLAPWEVIERKSRDILDRAGKTGHNGFIFNLGHGVLPETQPEILRKLTRYVRQYT